jgi:hypothetical protein
MVQVLSCGNSVKDKTLVHMKYYSFHLRDILAAYQVALDVRLCTHGSCPDWRTLI